MVVPSVPLCLGGNVFGWTLDESASRDVLDAFVARGGDFIDTADVYPTWVRDTAAGASERIIGGWLADRGLQERVVVATKVGLAMPGYGEGLSRSYVLDAVERSRERLGVDAIDVLYAHRPDPGTPILETMRAFDELVRRGVVREIALSNHDRLQLLDVLDTCAEHDLARPTLLQPRYNLIDRDEYAPAGGIGDLAEACVAEGIGVAPYHALAAGFLTGRYRRDMPPPPTPRAAGVLERYGHERGWDALRRADEVAARHEATPAQVAIAWLLTRPAVVAPIASATSIAHVDELFGALELQLDDQDLELLE